MEWEDPFAEAQWVGHIALPHYHRWPQMSSPSTLHTEKEKLVTLDNLCKVKAKVQMQDCDPELCLSYSGLGMAVRNSWCYGYRLRPCIGSARQFSE